MSIISIRAIMPCRDAEKIAFFFSWEDERHTPYDPTRRSTTPGSMLRARVKGWNGAAK